MSRAAASIGVLIAIAAACGGDYAEEAAPPKDDAGSDAPVTTDSGGQTGDAADASEVKTPVTPLSFVLRKIFLGETDRNGIEDANAWQTYGRDIDGIASTTNANGECKPHGNGTQTRVDGPGGVDNSFGKNIIPVS